MSKVIDVLEKASLRKDTHKQIDIQDEIAKTYFHSPPKKSHGRKKPKWRLFLPWVAAALAFIFAVAVMIFNSSIDIKVRFLGEIPTLPIHRTGQMKNENLDKGLFFIEGGAPNKDIVKSAFFMGDAREFSISKPDELVLCNSRGSGWANYSIELKEPVDMNNLEIRYSARGARGDEFLALVIVDSSRRSYRLEKDLASAMGKDWERYEVSFRRVRKAVDLSNIAAIKFEFGSLTAGNYPSAVMSLRDVYITKTRRLKWL